MNIWNYREEAAFRGYLRSLTFVGERGKEVAFEEFLQPRFLEGLPQGRHSPKEIARHALHLRFNPTNER